MTLKKRVAVLISGRGSNLLSLLVACSDPAFPAEIVLVISNEPAAGGLKHGVDFKVPTLVCAQRDFKTKEAHEAKLNQVLLHHRVDYILLAGYMRILSPAFVNRWPFRILNIHPSLLPDYPGLDTHARVLADGATMHGCTVHFVDGTVDGGPVIEQRAVPVMPHDTEETLAARVLAVEHELYPEVLRELAEGKVIQRFRTH